jgi:hypothetical protein
MSAPRLILKQPTGWFAAGREFARAIPLLSDGAFKLYVHACLRANRHTGRLDATVEELARAVETTPSIIAMNVDELEERAVCRVTRNGSSHLVLEIRDSFWPYLKQQTPCDVPEPEYCPSQRVFAPYIAPFLQRYVRLHCKSSTCLRGTCRGLRPLSPCPYRSLLNGPTQFRHVPRKSSWTDLYPLLFQQMSQHGQ